MIDTLKNVGISTLIQLVQILGSTVVIGLIIRQIANQIQHNILGSRFRFIYTLTALIGTPIHELGHAFMCLVFNHKIVAMKLFDPKAPDGVLGYVQHTSNKLSLYQQIGNFFIAIGPLFSGTIAMLTSLYFLLPEVFKGVIEALRTGLLSRDITGIFDTAINVARVINSDTGADTIAQCAVFLFIAISVSSHMALSMADLKGAFSGLLVIAGLLALPNLGLIGSNNFIATALDYLALANYAVSVTLCFSLILSAVSWLLSSLLARL